MTDIIEETTIENKMPTTINSLVEEIKKTMSVVATLPKGQKKDQMKHQVVMPMVSKLLELRAIKDEEKRLNKTSSSNAKGTKKRSNKTSSSNANGVQVA